MTKPKTYTTQSGHTLSDADIEAIAVEVAAKDYDVEALKTRRRGRPPTGAGPAEVVRSESIRSCVLRSKPAPRRST